jgi:hypothetical protein
MYAITDEETGRYLSRRSVPMIDTNGSTVYVTYDGKLGTEFFGTLYEAEIVLNLLLDRIRSCGVLRLLQIVNVNPENLGLGKQFAEILNMLENLAIFK